MKLFERLTRRLRRTQPSVITPAFKDALFDEIHAAKPYHAKQALEWTPEIAQANRFVDACAAAKLMRVYTELQGGQMPAAHPSVVERMVERELLLGLDIRKAREVVWWALAEQVVWKESQNENVTGLQPKQPLLEPAELAQAREVSRLRAEVQRIEHQRSERKRCPGCSELMARNSIGGFYCPRCEIATAPGQPEPFTMPTWETILAAAGGDEVRAKQLLAKLDELFDTIGP
jgi:ribosomal protein L37AE/L43A